LPDATPENSHKAPSFFLRRGLGVVLFSGRGIRGRKSIRQEKDLGCYLPDATPENS
jgi:hypothetical protein